MAHNLFPNEVYLEPNEHKYFDSEGNQYISFSALSKKLSSFDAEMVARNISRNNETTSEELLAKWKQTAYNGTRVDKALELFSQTGTILDSDQDLKELIGVVLEKYKSYNCTFEQGVPYCKEYRVAGSWDKLSVVSNRKDSRVHLSDFKCFEKGEDSLYKVSGTAWLKAPFEHLPNNKYTKISLQLSFYSYLFEKLTGRKVERTFIDLIVPIWDENHKLISFTNQVVPTIFMKNDVKILLETFKEDILEMLNPSIDMYVSDNDEIF